MNELTTFEKNAVAKGRFFDFPTVEELTNIGNFVRTVATAPYYQKMGAGGVLAIIMTARELNLPMMACLNGGMYTFSGKVTVSTVLMGAMIRNAGHYFKVLESNEQICRILFVRADQKLIEPDYKGYEHTFTYEEAKKAGLHTKDVWKGNTKAMLYNRCLSGGAKIEMGDVINNCYAFGELPEDNGPWSSDQYRNVRVETLKSDEIKEEKIPCDTSLAEETLSIDLSGFKEKYFIGTKGYCDIFINNIAEKSGKTFEYVVEAGAKNENKFIENFKKWKISKGLEAAEVV